MKKTKLLTSLAALALVLSLGACTEPEEEETTSEESGEVTTETDTTYEEEVSTEGAYAIVGDFVDADWDNEPATDSKYFIPAETEEFKVTVTTASEPVDNEWWTDTNQWDAGLSVVEYGTRDRVAGYTELDEASTGVKGSSASNDVSLAWNTTYDVTVTFGETNSILVTEKAEGEVEDQYEDNTITEMLDAIEQDCNYNATSYYYLYSSDYLETPAAVTMSAIQRFGCDVYATEDAIIFEYIEYLTTADGVSSNGWYYVDIQLFVNNYENGKCNYYTLNPYASTIYGLVYVESYDGTWKDTVYSLADLVEYKSAFTVSDTDYDVAYGNIEEYDVDTAALDTLINATVGNNYIWNDLFTTGGGWGDQYFGYPDYVSAEDIFSSAEAYDACYYGLYGTVVDFTFDDGGGWYQTSNGWIAREVMAWTDIYDVGTTSIPSGFESFL